MAFENIAEEKIQEAIATGEFDNLPGKGKPLNLNAYFATPEQLRMAYSILKSAEVVPEEMELLKQIERLNQSASSCENPAEKKMLQRQLTEKLTSFNLRMEQQRKKR
jgi:hypothetical protein